VADPVNIAVKTPETGLEPTNIADQMIATIMGRGCVIIGSMHQVPSTSRITRTMPEDEVDTRTTGGGGLIAMVVHTAKVHILVNEGWGISLSTELIWKHSGQELQRMLTLRLLIFLLMMMMAVGLDIMTRWTTPKRLCLLTRMMKLVGSRRVDLVVERGA
jgi:hypothetical protein